jgi:hypothetical protein
VAGGTRLSGLPHVRRRVVGDFFCAEDREIEGYGSEIIVPAATTTCRKEVQQRYDRCYTNSNSVTYCAGFPAKLGFSSNISLKNVTKLPIVVTYADS